MSFYKFAVGFVRCILKVMFRIEVCGVENVPLDEGFIMCANHKSILDAPVIGVSVPVEFSFMAKEEVFKFKIFEKLLKSLNVFPVKRGKGDLGAIRASMKALHDGGHLLVFPEGTRSRNEHMNEGKGGAVLIAVKSKVNIIPVGIEGTYKLFSKMTVRIGKPIDLSENFDKKIDTETITDIVDNKLMPTISELAKVPMAPKAINSGEETV